MVARCNECRSENVIKAGFDWRDRARRQRYRCKDCGKLFVMDELATKEQLKTLAGYVRKGIKISDYCNDLGIHAERRQDMTEKQADTLIKCIETALATVPLATPDGGKVA